MAEFTVTLGGTTNTPNAGFSHAYASNYTYTSSTGTNFSGAIDPALNTGRPFLVTTLRIYFQNVSSGAGKFACSNNATLNGTVTSESSAIGDLDATIDRVLEYPGYKDIEFYYGFIKSDGNTTNFYRGAESGSNVYSNGSIMSSDTTEFTDSAIYARLTFQSIPSAVLSLSATPGSDSIDLSWSAPTDDGGGSGLTGYRVAYKPVSGGTWEYLFTGGSTTSTTLNGLSGDTEYDIRVGALNAVTNKHNSEYNYSGVEYITGTAATTTATTATPYEAVTVTGLAFSRTVRVGDSGSDGFSGTNTYGDYGLSGTNFALTSGSTSLFSLSDLGNTSGTLNWSIPEGTSSQTTTATVTAYGPYSGGDTATESTTFSILQRLPVWTDDTISLTGRKGEYYSDSVSANYVSSWNDGALPTSGLTFSNGSIYGTINTYGNVIFTITPLNSDGSGPSDGGREFTIVVEDEELQWSDQIILNNVTIQGDTTYSEQVSVIPGPDVTYSVAPGYSLPAGLELNSSTGVLSANATTGITAEPNVYTFRIRATNGSGETLDTGNLNLSVEAAGGYVRVRAGGQWVEGTVRVRAGGQWVEGTAKVRAGGSWTDSFSS